jgi:predicted ABC-type transport system involved in lysophospholipase L1 biosynthesis ATPase subunit
MKDTLLPHIKEPDPQHELAVHVQGVDKSFGDGSARLKVLKDITLDVRSGEITMLVGPSGCGKTTLISIMAGTLGVDTGQVTVFGQTLTKMRKSAITKFRAKNIGFIFQQFHLIPTLTCVENASVPLLIQGVSTRKAEKKGARNARTRGTGRSRQTSTIPTFRRPAAARRDRPSAGPRPPTRHLRRTNCGSGRQEWHDRDGPL